MDYVIILPDPTSLWQMLLGAFSIGVVIGTGSFYFKFLSSQVMSKNLILWLLLVIMIISSYSVLVVEFWDSFKLVNTQVISTTWLVVMAVIGVFFSYFVSLQLREP